MDAGDVYRTRFPLPDRRGGAAPGSVQPRMKYVVVLQGGPDFASAPDVCVVVASTDRRSGPPRPFEVVVGPIEGFDHGTVIDCRWLYTVQRTTLYPGGTYRFTLQPPVLRTVRNAVVSGLQLLEGL